MHHAVMELRIDMLSTLSPRLSHISPRLPGAVLTCSRRNVPKRRHMFTVPWDNGLAKDIYCVIEKGEPGAAGQPLSKYCEANVSLALLSVVDRSRYVKHNWCRADIHLWV